MKAVVFAGDGRVRVDDVPPPSILEPTDAIVTVQRAAICASDLHVISGKTPGLRKGSVIGHEFVGVVGALGDGVTKHREGSRAVGSFLVACGDCRFCKQGRFNFCLEGRALGMGSLTGDLDGAQAEQVRVPNADVNLKPLTGALAGLSDEQALFSGDILATGFYAASLADIGPEDRVLVVGAGPVGLFCATAAGRAAPGRVLIGDLDEKRVEFAAEIGLDAMRLPEDEPEEAVAEATKGQMADIVVEAVGSVSAFRTALRCVCPGGRVAVVGVYGAERYELPMGIVWVRGIDVRFSGMANVQAHWDESLMATAKQEIDPTSVITHRLPLVEAEQGYELFSSHQAMKVVFEV
jgi:threonine dehydrogenase-like Zn-dependent dehydrogenase